MLPYPEWFSLRDQREMERARETARAPWDVTPLVFGGWYSSDADAINAVLIMFQAFISILERHTREAPHSDAEDYFVWLVDWTQDHRPLPTASSLTSFRAATQAQRDQQPWWQSFMTSTASRSVPLSIEAGSAGPSEPLTLEEAAKKLKRSVATVKRMIDRGEIPYVAISQRKMIPRSAIDRKLTEFKYQFPDTSRKKKRAKRR